MTSPVLKTSPGPRVIVNDGLVHIRELTSADHDLIGLAANSADPVEEVQRALAVGAKALALSRTSADVDLVQREFAGLIDRFAAVMSGALNDPRDGLKVGLTEWRRDFDAALAALFDPERSNSAVGKLDRVLRETGERQVDATRKLLDPNLGDGPLASLMAAIKEQFAQVLDAVARVAEQTTTRLTTQALQTQALESSTVKGRTFEQWVHETVAGVAAFSHDVAEAVGDASGISASKVGDIVVDVTGHDARYAIECKDRKLGVRAAVDELRRAMANREAAAAVMVFARQEQSPVPEPFAVIGEHAFVVLDKDEPQVAALRLACAWARARAIAYRGENCGTYDGALAQQQIEDARRALTRITSVRRAHSAATKQIQQAGAQVTDLQAELSDVLDRIERNR